MRISLKKNIPNIEFYLFLLSRFSLLFFSFVRKKVLILTFFLLKGIILVKTKENLGNLGYVFALKKVYY